MRTGIAIVLVGMLAIGPLGCSGGGSSNDGDGGGGGGCVVQETIPVNGTPYTSSDPCAGVMENQVFHDAEESNAHIDAHCDTVQACGGGGCAGGAGFAPDMMIVYVAGTASGCDAVASIDEVRACDDEIQVDYRIVGEGLCGTVIKAWSSAWVPYSDLKVVFKLLD